MCVTDYAYRTRLYYIEGIFNLYFFSCISASDRTSDGATCCECKASHTCASDAVADLCAILELFFKCEKLYFIALLYLSTLRFTFYVRM